MREWFLMVDTIKETNLSLSQLFQNLAQQEELDYYIQTGFSVSLVTLLLGSNTGWCASTCISLYHGI